MTLIDENEHSFFSCFLLWLYLFRLQILKYAFALLPQSETSIQLPKEPLNFHKFVHLSATTYPIRSNTHIRNTIASYPLDANLFKYFNMEPLTPSTWNYYVECDDAVHRIYRLHPLTAATNGISQYMGSNWFIISNEFAKYLAEVKEGTFVQQYIKYAERVATSDEIFFASVLKNSQFCTKHHNSHFLHHYFDRQVIIFRGCFAIYIYIYYCTCHDVLL